MRGFVVGDRILQSADTHPDMIAAHAEIGEFRLIAASTAGQSHLADGRPRDDAFAARSAGNWLAVAVSDGVGSRPLSRYGSTYAAEALCEQLIRIVTKSESGIQDQSYSGVPGGSGAPHSTHGDEEAAKQAGSGKALDSGRVGWTVVKAQPQPALQAAESQPPTAVAPTIRLTQEDDKDEAQPETSGGGSPEFAFEVEELAPVLGTSEPHGTMAWQVSPQPELDSPNGDATKPHILSDRLVRDAFIRVREGLDRFAKANGVEVREYACTLLGLLLNTRTGDAVVAHVGDGAIIGYGRKTGASVLVHAPAPDNPGEVYPFTKSDWESYLAIEVLDASQMVEIESLYLMTDGVSEGCLYPPPDDILVRWSSELLREIDSRTPPQSAAALLKWLATYRQRGSRDDRTLAVVYRRRNLEAAS